MRWLPSFCCLAVCLAVRSLGHGYASAPMLTIEELAAEADLIFKGEALESTPVADPSFEEHSGFRTLETRF